MTMEEDDDRLASLLKEATTLYEAVRGLRAAGVDARIVQPLDELLTQKFDAASRLAFGNRTRPTLETVNLARAAALATFLHERRGRSVKDALKRASNVLGLDLKQVKNFRDELNRGRANPLALLFYRSDLEWFRSSEM